MTPDSILMFHEMWYDYRRSMRLKRAEQTRRDYRHRVRLSLRWIRDERKEAAHAS
jgi:hypothetical protein